MKRSLILGLLVVLAVIGNVYSQVRQKYLVEICALTLTDTYMIYVPFQVAKSEDLPSQSTREVRLVSALLFSMLSLAYSNNATLIIIMLNSYDPKVVSIHNCRSYLAKTLAMKKPKRAQALVRTVLVLKAVKEVPEKD